MSKKVNAKWLAIAAKLKASTQQLKDAQEAHAVAVENAKLVLDASEKKLADAIAAAATIIDDVADTPPGTFPAITG